MSDKIVFVAGLTHSGSTILDFLLGAQSRLIGLGEMVALLDPATRKLDDDSRECSCGQSVVDCAFWGEVRRRLSRETSGALAQRYSLALRAFTDVFGREAVPVDSSKSLRALKLAVGLRPETVRVIHIIRDVRSWIVSRHDTDVRRHLYKFPDLYTSLGWRAWKPFVTRNAYARFLTWYLGNRQLERFLSVSGVPALQVSYENLCFSGPSVASELCAFVGVSQGDATADLATSRSHIALGKRVRPRYSERSALRYDMPWFYRTDWHGPTVVFPRVMRYNRTAAYKHTSFAAQ